MNNLTFVTALFDIGRGDIDEGFRRSFSHYLECFERLLEATKDYPLVVYIEPQNESIVWKHRSRDNTKVVVKTLDYLKAFPFFDDVQKIRQDESWINRAGWIPGSPQASLELYNPLVMSKQFMLNDASLFDFFDTKYFFWIDGGLNNTVQLSSYMNDEFVNKLQTKLNRVRYVAFPYDGTVEVHGFEKSRMNELAGAETEYVCRGGIFGGSKEYINRLNDVYYNLLHSTLKSGYMGTEESIFTILSYKHPELCDVSLIDSNGLVYKFFEDVIAEDIPTYTTPLAIYSLTYNAPEQFRLWAESFSQAYPKEFTTCAKYVFDNTDDDTHKEEYTKLYEHYGFEVIAEGSNAGINGGRQRVAEHFNDSNHEFMVFFEDDMLLSQKDDAPCKCGFTRWQPSLFDVCMDIMRIEKLDYLKLSFSEFFGTNHDNWAWYNLPENKRQEYFPERDDTDIKRTRVSYTATHKSVPYAVGEYHYCNWPLMFGKQGNQKVFLDIVWEYKYEQTWMSNTMMLMRDGKIKAGCLLASPINHNRVHHYTVRKENETY